MELFLFFFFSTSNFCYAILNTTLYIITSTSSSGQYQVPQQQVVVGNAVVGSTVLSLQLEQVLVGILEGSTVVGSSRYGTGSSRQWQERTRGTQQIRSRQQYKYCSTSSITTYQRTTVDTKSMIRTYVVQYVHSQQREKNEFNAGRRIQR